MTKVVTKYCRRTKGDIHKLEILHLRNELIGGILYIHTYIHIYVDYTHTNDNDLICIQSFHKVLLSFNIKCYNLYLMEML